MTYSFSTFNLYTKPPLLMRDGDVVHAAPRAVACLVLLVERRHTAVSKRELMETLWPDSFVEEGSLTQLVSVLRKPLAPGFPDSSPIQTIPKMGYRFAAEVRVVADAASASATLDRPAAIIDESHYQPIPEEVDVEKASDRALEALAAGHIAEPGLPSASSAPIRLLGIMTMAFIAVAIAVLPGRHRAVHYSDKGGRYALAVLPFQNLSRAADAAWVSVAVQEMLATDLRLSSSFRVLSSEEVNRALAEVNWPGEADPSADTLRRLSSDLDCSYTVLGAYLLKGGRVRLDVRVVDIHTGGTVQESTFEQPESALLSMLADVSSRTATGLGVSTDGAEKARSGSRPATRRRQAVRGRRRAEPDL